MHCSAGQSRVLPVDKSKVSEYRVIGCLQPVISVHWRISMSKLVLVGILPGGNVYFCRGCGDLDENVYFSKGLMEK